VTHSDKRSENLCQKLTPSDQRSERCVKSDTQCHKTLYHKQSLARYDQIRYGGLGLGSVVRVRVRISIGFSDLIWAYMLLVRLSWLVWSLQLFWFFLLLLQ